MNLYKSPNFRIGMYLCIVSSVFSLAFLDPINWPKQVALVTLTPLILLHSLKLGTIRDKFLVVCVLALVVFSLTSVFFTSNPIVRELWGTFGRNNGLMSFLSFTVLIICGYLLGGNSRELPRLLLPIQIMTGLAGIYGVVQVMYLDPIKWSQDGQAFAFFGNINFASAIFALGAISSAAQLFLNQKNRFLVIVHTTLLIFQLIMIYLTESIQGFMMFAISGVLFIFLLIQRRSQKISVLFLIFASFVGSFVLVSFFGFGPLGDSLYQYTLKLRYYYWLSGIFIGLKHFWFGAGFDSYGDYYRFVRPTDVIDLTGIDITVNNAHNAIIQLFATLGIFPAILMLLLYVIGSFKCAQVLISKNFSMDKKVVAILFVPLAINSLFSIDNISIAVWNHLFLGCALSLGSQSSIREAKERNGSGSARRDRSRSGADFNVFRIFGISTSIMCFILAWSSSYPERAIVSAFQTQGAIVNQIDPRVVSLRNIAFNSMTRDQDFRYIAEGLSTLGQNEVAIEVLYEGIRRFPREYQLYDYLAVFLERLNRKDDAIEIRREQLKLDPSHPKIWLYYALDLNEVGRNAAAVEAFENVIKLKKYLSQEDIAKLESYRSRINR